MPIASIVMPCHNAAKFVENSVTAILQQTCREFELIIVDDASKDGSSSILRNLAKQDKRIKLLIHEKNCGASRSRNDGLRVATGEYVGFCDADDIWKPEKLALQIKSLAENHAYDITYCDSEIIDENGLLLGHLFSDRFPAPALPSGNLFEELCATNFVNMQTVLVRRLSLGDRIFFDENIKWVEDWWQWVRLSSKHRFLYDSRVLAQYRVHANSTNTTQKPGIRKNRWKVCKRILKSHNDLPLRMQALLWYQMGVELTLLNRHHLARRFLCHATYLGFKGKSSPKSILTMSARSGIACYQSWSA